MFSKENLPVCPLFQNWWGKERQARAASLSQTCLPSSAASHALPHPLGKFHRCPIVSPVAFQRSHYPRVFSKADPPQSEQTQPEGTALQGLCAKPSQESRPGVPQARPAEGASPQKKRSCLPRTEFPWSPALSPSFTRTASRGTHCRELSWPSGPDRLPPLTLFLGRLLPVSRHCLSHHQPRNSSSCLCCALGVWEGSGLAGLRGRGGAVSWCPVAARHAQASEAHPGTVSGIGRKGTDIVRLLWQGLGSSVTCPLTPLPPPATCVRESGVFTYPHFAKSLF